MWWAVSLHVLCVRAAASESKLSSFHFHPQLLDALAQFDGWTQFDSQTLNKPNGSQIQQSFTINLLREKLEQRYEYN